MAESEYRYLIQRGKDAMQKKLFDDAILHFEKAIDLDKENPEAYVDLGNVYTGLKKTVPAKVAYRQALSFNNRYWRAWHNLGLMEHNLGNHNQAIELLKEALTCDIQYRTLNTLGNCYFELKDYESAEYYYLKAIKLEPESLMAKYGLGRIFRADKRYEQLLELLSPYETSETVHREQLLYFLAQAKYALKAYSEAANLFEGLLTEFPASNLRFEYLTSAGVNLLELEQFSSAERLFAQAVELVPESVNAWVNVTWAALQAGDELRVEELISRSLELHADSYRCLFSVALVHRYKDENQQAVEWILKCLELNPDYIEAQVVLIYFYFVDGEHVKAHNLVAQVLTELSNFQELQLASYLKDVGTWLESLEKYDLAKPFHKRFSELMRGD